MSEFINTAVLLVAGTGSRLRPLTNDVPKALVAINGRPILERAVSALRAHGVQKFVFATGYRQDALRAAVAALGIDASFCHNPDFETTQNSISLLHCRSALAGVGFYKLDGDVLFDADVLQRLDSVASELSVAVDSSRALDAEAMKVVVGERGSILKFGKAISVNDAHGESIGIERIRSSMSEALFEAVRTLQQGGVVNRYYEDVYSELISSKQVEAKAAEVGDLRWAEIDDVDDLARAAKLFD